MQVLDKASIFLARMTIDNAKAAGHPIVMIPIHWAPDAFMSQKQFEEFWWPPFRQMMIEMIDAGLVPMPLWEADCIEAAGNDQGHSRRQMHLLVRAH